MALLFQFKRFLNFLYSRNVAIFLVVWLVLGCFINRDDQLQFSLMHAGVDAVVSHGTLAMGKSVHPVLKERGKTYFDTRTNSLQSGMGDAFYYKGEVYLVKQPGSFFVAAPAYFLVKHFITSYEENFDLATSLVSFFSSTLLVALATLCLFLLLHKTWGFSFIPALVSALCYPAATNSFTYSGMLYHDTLATAFLIIAFYLLVSAQASSDQQSPHKLRFFTAGCLLGMTLFASMLPAFVVLSLLLFVAALRNIRNAVTVYAGFVVGCIPLGISNAYHFGSPFTQANVASKFDDTYFSPNLSQFLSHLDTYLGWGDLSILKFSPVMVLGFVGLLLMLRRRINILPLSAILVALALHLFYILNIATVGHCQFGPRYLLPFAPFLVIGLAWFLEPKLHSPTKSKGLTVFTVILITISVVISTVGAIGGGMYCKTEKYAFLAYIQQANYFELANFPFALELMTLLLVYALGAGIHKYRTLALAQE